MGLFDAADKSVEFFNCIGDIRQKWRIHLGKKCLMLSLGWLNYGREVDVWKSGG